MSRLIDADVLLEHIKKLECHAGNKKYEQARVELKQAEKEGARAGWKDR